MNMKTMLKLPQLCGAVLLLSCTTSELPPDKVGVTPTSPAIVVTNPNPDNFSSILPGLYPFADTDRQFYIKEKTSYTSNMNVNALFSTKMASPDMGEIVKSGEKVNMVAIGGGLTAGFRNGGLYRAGQMTAYPNLVARQMGIADFQSPLFSENEANGTGYVQLIDDGSKYPTWKEVTSNLAILKAGGPPELPKYVGGRLNNYGIPETGHGFSSRICNDCGIGYNNKTWTNGTVFASRMSPNTVDNSKVSLQEQMFKQPVNFFMVEDDFDMLIALAKDNSFPSFSTYGYNLVSVNRGTYPIDYKKAMQLNTSASKGVVFTWPLLPDLAYFNWYDKQELIDKAKSLSISTSRNGETFIHNRTSNFLLKPTPNVDTIYRNLKKGDDLSISLANNDIIDSQEFNINVNFIKQYNELVRKSAKESNLALVDLEKIYSQIHNNTYNSNSELLISGGLRGNFFSADGIYPTAIGQAVIANEVIKSINSTYKSNIPIINLSDYSKLVGKE